jgi:hypothetical protein
MRLSELLEEQEPLLFSMMRKARAAGKKIAWYIRSGDSTKPVWIHSWKHDELAPSPGQTEALPFWQLTGYQGYRAMYRNLLDADLDKWTLVAGKTKGTLQLKRRVVTNEGVGSELMLFMDYLKDRFPGNDAGRDTLRKFATYLFKHGYTYSEGPSNGDFVKGIAETGKVRVVVPQKHWPSTRTPGSGRNKVALHYFEENEHRSYSSSGSIPLTLGLEQMVDELTAFEKNNRLPT